ncbi:MAG: hypothetical protein KAI70_02415 [Candidatus Omnitrophica bacterium]|nr:hypothetical protein [Candidatus Omnitrophota bacterium]
MASLEKKEKIKLAMLFAALMVLVFVLMSNGNREKKKDAVISDKIPVKVTSAMTKKINNNKVKRTMAGEGKKELLGVGRQDPFVVPDEKYMEQSVIGPLARLKGITLDSKGKPLAIIGSEIVGIGDKVGDAEVLDITKDTVVVGLEGEEHILRLWEERV